MGPVLVESMRFAEIFEASKFEKALGMGRKIEDGAGRQVRPSEGGILDSKCILMAKATLYSCCDA